MCLPSSSWDSLSALPSCFFCFTYCTQPSLSLCFSGCHFQSLLSCYPFPLLTHSELSIAASLPHFPSSPTPHPPHSLSCLHVHSRSVSRSCSFPPSLNLLSYGSFSLFCILSPLPPHLRSLFPRSFPLSLVRSLSLSFSMSLTQCNCRIQVSRAAWLTRVQTQPQSWGHAVTQRSTLTSTITAPHWSSIDCLAVPISVESNVCECGEGARKYTWYKKKKKS